MPRHSLPPRTRRRSSTPAIVIIVAIIGLAVILNGWPLVVSLFGFSTATAIDPGPPAKTDFVLAEAAPVAHSRSGVCQEHSVFVPRTDAWSCEVGGIAYDPCFAETAAGATPAIICGAEALSGASGFAVEGAVPAAAASDVSSINPAMLGDLYYLIDRIGTPVKLVKGQYYAPYVESVGQGMLIALSGMRAAGDLDRDGDEDYAVLLVADAGDDRMFIYLGAVINDAGQPSRTTAIELGDRVKVDHLAIRNGQIAVRMTTHDIDDPACCPTLDVTWYYTLQGERLYQYVDGWRIELQGGIQCVPVQASQIADVQMASANAAMPFAYKCSNGIWLRNGLRPGKVWYAEMAGQSRTGSQEPLGASAALSPFVPVVRVWQ